MFDTVPEWVRYAIVLGFPLVAFGAALLAIFAGGHEHDEEDIQQGGDWCWPDRESGLREGRWS
jgi:hypothetical protein